MSKRIGSVEDFYEWVKGRAPTELYKYDDYTDCAIARYCRERGVYYNPAKETHEELETLAQLQVLRQISMGEFIQMGELREAIEIELRLRKEIEKELEIAYE